MFVNMGFTAKKMAKQFKCSIALVYKQLYEEGIHMRDRYRPIPDDQLDVVVTELHDKHPNTGATVLIYCDFHLTENSDIIKVCKVYSTSCQTLMSESLKFIHLYSYFHSVSAIYRTQIEYIVSVTRQRLTTGTVKFT